MEDKKPKIICIDIETSPIVAYTWGPKYETNIIDFLEQTQILSYSAKWLGGKQITRGLVDLKNYKKNIIDDKPLVIELQELLDKADIVVTQNGISFDHKIINARLIKHNLAPPSPYKMVDTKIEAKRYLKLPSYGLDDMGKYFDIGEKMHNNGFELWKKCISGDEKAWRLMKKYNAQDVVLTEKLYLKIRPFMKSHPNLSAYTKERVCPKCSSNKVQLRGFSVNGGKQYQRAQCQNCSGWFRLGKPETLKKAIETNI